MNKVKDFFGASVQRKLVLAFLLVVGVFAAIVLPIAYFGANSALSSEASEAIAALASVGEGQFLKWKEDLELNLLSFSANDTVVSAVRAFSNSIDTSQELGLDAEERLGNLRSAFLGRPDLLDAEELSSPYTSVHERYHPFFEGLAQVYGYSDVLLVNDQGLVVYSVMKNDEVFTSLVDGTYAESSLGNLVDQMLAAGDAREPLISLVDFVDYSPAGKTTAFIAATIYDENVFRGALVFALPLDLIDGLVNLRTGFGDTGEVYVIGSDSIPRSSNLEQSVLAATGSIFISTDAVDAALRGETGIGYTTNYRGLEVLSAWQPVVIEEPNGYGSAGVTWALISEIQASEALAPARELIAFLGIALLVGTVVVVLLSFGVATQISGPIFKLTEAVKKVTEGNYNLNLTVQSSDEIGTLGKAFNRMSEELHSSFDSLEGRVRARTRDLELAAMVSAQVTTELNLDRLLPQIAEATEIAFELYHVGVYLYEDDPEPRLVFTAGTGDAGQKMQEGLLGFDITDMDSVVARSAREWHVVYIKDVRQRTPASSLVPSSLIRGDSQKIDTNLVFESIESQVVYDWLPETRSHLALPMIVRDKLLGVLDLHSKMPEAFTEDDLSVLVSLAQQLAIAVQNARSYGGELAVNEELRKVSDMKTSFLASMSHELRTPLNSIINFQKIVIEGWEGSINESQADFLGQSVASADHLLKLINDILDISKIQAGLMELAWQEDVDIRRGISEALVMVNSELKAREKTIELRLEIADDLPTLRVDPLRIKQIIVNLATNAVKFTDKGYVCVRAFAIDDHVVVEVQDTGVGVAESELDLIFNPFEQSESGKASAQGTGLGLPISRNLAEAHGGRLEVKSEVGKGSTFTLYLPRKRQDLTQDSEKAVSTEELV